MKKVAEYLEVGVTLGLGRLSEATTGGHLSGRMTKHRSRSMKTLSSRIFPSFPAFAARSPTSSSETAASAAPFRHARPIRQHDHSKSSLALGGAGTGPALDGPDPRALDPQRRGSSRQRPGRRRPDVARCRARAVAMALPGHAAHGHPAHAFLVSPGARLGGQCDHAGERRHVDLAFDRGGDVLAGVEDLRSVGGGLGDSAAGLLVDRHDLAVGTDHGGTSADAWSGTRWPSSACMPA